MQEAFSWLKGGGRKMLLSCRACRMLVRSERPASVAWHVTHPLGVGFDARPNRVITKDIQRCTFCFYDRWVTIKVLVGKMPWSQTGATHYHSQLGHPDKGLLYCWNLWRVFKVFKAQGAWVWSLVKVMMAIEIKYRKTSLKHNRWGAKLL